MCTCSLRNCCNQTLGQAGRCFWWEHLRLSPLLVFLLVSCNPPGPQPSPEHVTQMELHTPMITLPTGVWSRAPSFPLLLGSLWWFLQWKIFRYRIYGVAISGQTMCASSTDRASRYPRNPWKGNCSHCGLWLSVNFLIAHSLPCGHGHGHGGGLILLTITCLL